MTRVLVVGDVRLYRDGLAQALRGQADVEVVGTSVANADALSRLEELEPDIVLIDLMQGGIALIRDLGARRPPVRVFALAVRDREDEVLACAEAGVAGYVTRDASFGELVQALASVARGETLASARMTAALFRRVAALAAKGHPRPELPPLTARESEVIELVEQGLTNKEIARALHIELPTVKNHIHHILDKFQVQSRRDAVARFRAALTP